MTETQTQAAKQEVLCSYGTDVKSGAVRPFQFASLRAFAGWIKSLPPVVSKLDSSYLVCATFSTSNRTLVNLRDVTMVQLDYDVVTPGLREAVCATLEALAIGFVAFDTFSNGGKFCVLIPLSRAATVAEHAATLSYLVGELGAYSNFDPASKSPVLPRFLNPNANSPAREITLHDAPFLVPVAAAADNLMPANVASIAPIPPKQDRFALYTSQGEPEHKELFLVALRHKLLPADRSDNYPRWFPVLFAGFRAWAINSRELTESQRVLLEALNVWSASDPKYVKGCVEQKLGDWLRDGDTGQKLHIHSLLSHEIDSARLRSAINEDNDLDLDQKITLIRALDKLVGTPVITVIDSAVAEAAATERAREVAEINAVKRAGQVILNKAPKPTQRFSDFLDVVAETAMQGKVAEHWQLEAEHPNEWGGFLSPIATFMSLVQIASMGFMPHVLFRMRKGLPASSLTLWFLHIATQGAGKSEVHKSIQPILDGTVFKFSYQKEKFFSATGMWSKFERCGNIQLMYSDEAESLFGKSGHADGNLATLHSAAKQLKDQGRSNSVFTPNTQVQREVRALRAPTLIYNLAGTPALLKDIPEDMWVDGFLSRFTCVFINPVDRSHDTPEQIRARLRDQLDEDGIDDVDVRTERAIKFFNKLWVDAGHPNGKDFFLGTGELGGELDFNETVTKIVEHFEHPHKPRYIQVCDGNDAAMKDKFADLFAKCLLRWETPPDSPNTKAFGALYQRAVINLQLFASVLTLIADPRAKYINYELAVWAEEFLYHAQIGVYEWLKKRGATDTPTVGVLRFETKKIDALRVALEPGGLLHDGSVVKARELREKYRSWRALLDDLRAPGEANKMVRITAEQILYQLGVQMDKQGQGLVFSMKPKNAGELE